MIARQLAIHQKNKNLLSIQNTMNSYLNLRIRARFLVCVWLVVDAVVVEDLVVKQ